MSLACQVFAPWAPPAAKRNGCLRKLSPDVLRRKQKVTPRMAVGYGFKVFFGVP